MFLYVVDHGQYFPVSSGTMENGDKTLSIVNSPLSIRSVYVNLTNRCNNACEFCLRNLKSHGLWLEREPTAEEIFVELSALPVEEVVICGYGEPTCRQAELVKLLRLIKNLDAKVRLNTNGLGNLENRRDITGDYRGLIDAVSISLNASTPERYFEVTKSKFGLKALPGLLAFAEGMTKICSVTLTVVDVVTPVEEIARCQQIAQQLGAAFRLRPFEDN